MTIPVKDFLDKFPGGMIIFPLIIGCILNTLCPEVLQIGSFTTGLATGSASLMAVLFIIIGSQLNLKCAPQALKTGFTLVVVKLLTAVIIGVISAKLFNNALFGLSSLAIIAAVSNSNGAMYATLTGQYGTPSDQGATAIISLNDGPFLTMITMGAAGIASIPYMSLVAAIVPLIVGIILGNIDPKLRECLGKGMDVVVLTLAFAIGCTMNLGQIVQGGLSGIILGIMAVGIGGATCIIGDKLSGGSGIAGAAISSVAANAIATPAALAAIDPSLTEIAGVATAQITASVIVTCLATPFLAAWVMKGNKKKHQSVNDVA